ncbi:MAG: hypothetical protein ABIJ82_03990 [Patescibacteria group bacterium]|nr:hypothetical protein [Patescibacteria group bacterium]MBU1952663.1 hypothetical protein [Patescibacteria group bacterium]
MKEKIQKVSNNFARLITNEVISYKIYLYWAAIAVLLMGIFGVYPFTRELIGKYQISRQMTKLNKDLSKKYNEISDASEKIKLVGTDVLYLNGYLPENFDPQNYMIDFVTASGNAGYYVDTFVPTGQEGSVVEIVVALFGEGDLTQLMENLENLNRVSEIQNVELVKRGASDTLRLNIKTYIMEKQ